METMPRASSSVSLKRPSTVTVLTEIELHDGVFWEIFRLHPAFPIALTYLWYVGLLAVLRHRCLKHADRYLGRVGTGGRTPGLIERLRGRTSSR